MSVIPSLKASNGINDNTTTIRTSKRADRIPEALSISINQMVYDLKRQGRDIITLSLGEAFFDIPLFDFGAIDFNKGYHYSDSQGIPELRDKIADYYDAHYDAPVNGQDEILITAGSKIAIYLAMLSSLDPGAEVLIHEPAWLSYQEQVRLCDSEPRFIPYFVEVKNFKDFINQKTKMIILNNPNNPSGRVYSRDELTFLYKLCQEKGIYLMVDEAYSDFVIDDSFYSAVRLDENKTNLIVVNSLSKNMGMSGWRVGYVISNPEFIKTILKLNQHLITCAPTVLLYYMAKYFDNIIAHTLPQVREIVIKRNRVKELFDHYDIKYLPGGATFYFFVSLENYEGSGWDFAVNLLHQHGIAVVPGSAYGESTERFIRFSIGAESMDRIEEAIKVISTLISPQS